MVIVVQQPQSPLSQTTSSLSNIWNFFAENWWVFLAGLIIMIFGIAIYYILKSREEERKERDDVTYEDFKNTTRDCQLQRRPKLIRKKWSPINLLWLGLPIIKTDYSAKIVNYTNDILGYYRGETTKMDSTYNILCYKFKWFIFIEQQFLIKCPMKITVKMQKVDPLTNKVLKDSKGQPITEEKIMDFSKFIDHQINGDIKISCTHLERVGYYRVPVYVTKDKEVLDIREYLGEKLMHSAYSSMLNKVLATGSKQVEKAMLHNPWLVYEQKAPEKTKAEKNQERE